MIFHSWMEIYTLNCCLC